MKASGFKTYGPLKALSEQETKSGFPENHSLFARG